MFKLTILSARIVRLTTTGKIDHTEDTILINNNPVYKIGDKVTFDVELGDHKKFKTSIILRKFKKWHKGFFLFEEPLNNTSIFIVPLLFKDMESCLYQRNLMNSYVQSSHLDAEDGDVLHPKYR